MSGATATSMDDGTSGATGASMDDGTSLTEARSGAFAMSDAESASVASVTAGEASPGAPSMATSVGGVASGRVTVPPPVDVQAEDAKTTARTASARTARIV